MAPTLSDSSADKTAHKIEHDLKNGEGLQSIRDEVDNARKAQGSGVNKDAFKAWTQKVEDKLHNDGILPRLDITFHEGKADLTGISGDGKFDGKGDLITSSGKDGRFDFTYNKDGQLNSIRDSQGQVDYKYSDGQWTNQKDGTKAEIAVDTQGNIIVMHENGTQSEIRHTGEDTERNAEGQVTSQTSSGGTKRTYEYNDQGQISNYSQTDKNGNLTFQATRNGDGTYSAMSAGADGKMGTDDDQKTQLKNLEIDNKENLTITNADGSSEKQRVFGAKEFYDPSNRLSDVQTTNGKDYHYDYSGDGKDPVGLTISTKGPDGKWDTPGQPGDDKVIDSFKLKDGQVTETDANGKTTTFKGGISIDDQGRAIVSNSDKHDKTTFGLSGAIKKQHHGKVNEVINPDGTESDFSYKGGQLQQVTLFKGTDQEQDYTYENGKWMVKDSSGNCQPADVVPTVDDHGNVRLTSPNGDKAYTEYTPMGTQLQGYNEPDLLDGKPTTTGSDAGTS